MRKPTAWNGRQSKQVPEGERQTPSGRSQEKETRGSEPAPPPLSSDSQSIQVSRRGRLTWLRYGTGREEEAAAALSSFAGERLLGQSELSSPEGAWPTARSRFPLRGLRTLASPPAKVKAWSAAREKEGKPVSPSRSSETKGGVFCFLLFGFGRADLGWGRKLLTWTFRARRRNPLWRFFPTTSSCFPGKGGRSRCLKREGETAALNFGVRLVRPLPPGLNFCWDGKGIRSGRGHEQLVLLAVGATFRWVVNLLEFLAIQPGKSGREGDFVFR
ncbi:hypothetical protein L345_02928, partial [Ophiophagus hannah]